MEWVGTIRAAEVTHGKNGFHPHLHPVHLFERDVTASEVRILHVAELRAWIAAAGRLGLSSPFESAQSLEKVRAGDGEVMGDYFAKAVYQPSPEAVGWEMTSTQTKSRTRASSSRTPWQILESVYSEGDADDLALWHTFEQASKGKRAISWSRGLRSLAGLDVEATDQEIAETEIGTELDTGITIADWAPMRRCPALGAELLRVVKNGTRWADGLAFCRANGIEISEPVERLRLTQK